MALLSRLLWESTLSFHIKSDVLGSVDNWTLISYVAIPNKIYSLVDPNLPELDFFFLNIFTIALSSPGYMHPWAFCPCPFHLNICSDTLANKYHVKNQELLGSLFWKVNSMQT